MAVGVSSLASDGVTCPVSATRQATHRVARRRQAASRETADALYVIACRRASTGRQVTTNVTRQCVNGADKLFE
ncbi:hypothetical protein BHM03_00044827 [Ensete ventricosum]|nr:hypothetical protein BHM03_00044827 [Ensete ventricosum]